MDRFLQDTLTPRVREAVIAFAESDVGYLEITGDVYSAELFRADGVAVVLDELDPDAEMRVPLEDFVRLVRGRTPR
ncbi:hypothetical protein [Cellulosimicrobium sp. Marseille-Q4280]|uniref:hypothetical protein n=1 Tax=Cellulosimicrobium sp. Marseille-Q4280 TaxID=2937992 RepID=UPI00203B6E86|nr:hypothetical protein [Cellulosimicrobium sp. Marseille-Q4280]